MSPLLLDTHVFIWYVNGNRDLNKTTLKSLTNAFHLNQAFLAPISLWEMSMLHKKQRIILEMPYLEWVNKAIELTRINVLALTPAIANESCELPGHFHDDPADRMIVATARVENLTLVTRDKRILAYGRHKYISTMMA